MVFSVVFCVLAFSHSINGFCCINDQTKSECSFPETSIEVEIDDLLTEVEYGLFEGKFEECLNIISNAERLVSDNCLIDSPRSARMLFDKAFLYACLEGNSEKTSNCFQKLEGILDTKSCLGSNSDSKQRQNWPFYGPESMTIHECLCTVKNTMEKVHIAAAALPVGKANQFVIQSALYALERAAERCCQKSGFWKTCIQPLVNAWKDMEILKIPPDPAWD